MDSGMLLGAATSDMMDDGGGMYGQQGYGQAYPHQQQHGGGMGMGTVALAAGGGL
ncbi:hypothetical protein HaLaN_31504, partial [Haematococcus lacustris]